jgi:hypothetical protein
MHDKRRRLQFDPDEFFELVLTETDSQGNARTATRRNSSFLLCNSSSNLFIL